MQPSPPTVLISLSRFSQGGLVAHSTTGDQIGVRVCPWRDTFNLYVEIYLQEVTLTEQSVASAVDAAIYPMPVLPPHGQRRLIRESAGLSINALARVVGTTRFSIRNWELGVSEPSARFDLRYRRALAAMQAA